MRFKPVLLYVICMVTSTMGIYYLGIDWSKTNSYAAISMLFGLISFGGWIVYYYPGSARKQ